MGISFKEVSHLYPTSKRKVFTVALDKINLNINDTDEFIALVGKTGSGKSTLMEHMNALLLPSSGLVDIMGSVITPKKNKNPKLKDVRKKVGFVFQFPEYQLFEETVLKDIMFAGKNFGMKEEEAKEKALETAKLLKIDENLLKKSPFNLSGGQMRKVAIAGILAYNPDILLLDEPTRGLDPKTADEIMELFYELHKRTHKTIVLISHDMDLVYKYATRVVVLNSSKIVYDGDKVNLFSSSIYEENHLSKPDVLKMIDYLNETQGYSLEYNIFNEQELLEQVVKLHE
ncbi:MAG: energy-coupling factor transporter ATPase [Roseburia sp.]|nr:energy-coupling factor transporter ATPase [Anaeroplasma bactoclasticum]MCM1195967.1 energy-coupling factor transporter ATPase [Roseburia sp.]MCM1556421.1 energy-coupling factor transporter ATPase [Anaeroplasma bactoclasticum]